jgi:hypothetical protein
LWGKEIICSLNPGYTLSQSGNTRIVRALAAKKYESNRSHNCAATNQTNSAGKAVSDQAAGPAGSHFLKSHHATN